MARKKRHQNRNYVHAHFRILSGKRTLEQIRKFPDTFGYVWTAENDSNMLRVDAKVFPILNFTQFVNRNVKILRRRLHSPSLKNAGWIGDAQLIFSKLF